VEWAFVQPDYESLDNLFRNQFQVAQFVYILQAKELLHQAKLTKPGRGELLCTRL
jgi:hypothetical protein